MVLVLYWYGMVWYGVVWYGVVWYRVVWYGMYVYVCIHTFKNIFEQHTDV